MTQPSVREHAIKLREKSPCMTLQAIGDKCGVSKERVRQILQSEGMETKHLDTKTKYYCSRCGKRIKGTSTRKDGTKVPRQLCQNCYDEWHHTKVTCSVCGKEFEMRTGVLMTRLRRSKSKQIICSSACRGKAKCKYDHLFRPIARDNANGMSVRSSFIKYGIPLGYQNILTQRMIKLGYKLRSEVHDSVEQPTVVKPAITSLQ
jgi:DNA-directed RNA polymerase subunit RPC12/RpoP